MMDDTLTILSLEPNGGWSQNTHASHRDKSGHHNAPGKNQEVSRVVRNAHLCVACQHSSSGTSRTQILTTLQTFRQRIASRHHAEKRLQDDHRKFPAMPPKLCLPRQEPIAPLRMSLSLILLWLRVRLTFPPITDHVLLIISNTVPQTRIHDAHELRDFRSRHRLRHQVGGVHARADLLRDEPA